MKFLVILFILAAAFFETACTTNPETGEQAVFGVVPVETLVNAGEVVANEAKGSGGILGIAGTIAAVGIAYWRRRKELAEKSNAEKAKAIAVSVIDGVDAIIEKIEDAKTDGWTPTKDELLALLKAAQNAAGTRDGVNEILAEKHKT